MTVKELIKELSSLESDAQIIVRFMKGDLYGTCWEDFEDFDECDFQVTGHTVIIDFSNK